jgi:hypothetical protein
MGGSPKHRHFTAIVLSLAFRELEDLSCFDPGAHAPGSMLAPASQVFCAKPTLAANKSVSQDIKNQTPTRAARRKPASNAGGPSTRTRG